MSKKTNALLASAVAASFLMMAAQSASAAAPAAAGSVEQRLKMMEDQMNAMKAEMTRVRSEAASSARVSELESKVAKQASSGGSAHGKKSNMVFFRGGYTKASHARSGELLTGPEFGGPLSNSGLVAHQNSDKGDGWYTGAGFDFSLSDNLFGLTDQAELAAELMFDYKNFGSSYNPLVKHYTTGLGPNGGGLSIKNQVTMFSLSASPKIKFMPGSAFRPWIIPVGLAVHVISPPSSGVTVLNPGLMTGVGADYQLFKDIYAGVDFRYNFTGNDLAQNSAYVNGTKWRLKGMSTDGFTTGAYLGIGF